MNQLIAQEKQAITVRYEAAMQFLGETAPHSPLVNSRMALAYALNGATEQNHGV